MLEVYGNIWDYPATVRVITTNGDVNRKGLAVMGRGVALQAAERLPHVREDLGSMLFVNGNVVQSLGPYAGCAFDVWTFPVKHHWGDRADLKLIERSAREIMNFAIRTHQDGPIVLPRPGCGNGQLEWADVKPIIEPILDDRFHVITFKEFA